VIRFEQKMNKIAKFTIMDEKTKFAILDEIWKKWSADRQKNCQILPH